MDRGLLESVFHEARKCFPEECCGWLAGPREETRATRLRVCTNAQAEGNHPTQADRGLETAYVLSGSDLLAMSRELDGDDPAKVLYHSHCDGRAYFSETDQQGASDPWGEAPLYPLQQLVVGITPKRVEEAALFGWSDEHKSFVEIARYDGADI